MIFLIALALAALFIVVCAKPLKRHPAPFYAAAVLIALAVTGCTVGGVSFPGWFQDWVWPMFSRSAFATALFVVVMWTGALPNGSRAIRFLMPIRGELSILACILTLGHNAAYGRTYFRFLFTQPSRLPANQAAAAVCSLVMICIMLPLFVTSFKAVRRKMKGAAWKRLQRFAYGLYALLYVHIMLLSVPYARSGRGGYLLNILIYSLVFLGYGLCRILKAWAVKSKQTGKLFRRQVLAAAGALAVSLCLTGALWVSTPKAAALSLEEPQQTAPQSADELPAQETPEPSATPEQMEAEAPESPAPSEAPVQPEDVQDEVPSPAQEESTSTEPEKEPAAAPTSTPAPAPSTEPTPEPTPDPTPEPTPMPTPEPARIYQNGTFSGTGQGFEGPITVSVTIQDDVITGISVTSASDDEPYFTDGLTVIRLILAAQSANVDTVSGATYSSGGIIDAVAAALASAKN